MYTTSRGGVVFRRSEEGHSVVLHRPSGVILRQTREGSTVVFSSIRGGSSVFSSMSRHRLGFALCIVLGVILSAFVGQTWAHSDDCSSKTLEKIGGIIREALREDCDNGRDDIDQHQMLGDASKLQKAMVYGSVYQNGYYYVDVLIGTPPQRQSVMLSMLDSTLSIPCDECQNCGHQHMDEFFDVGKSRTGEYVGCRDPRCVSGECDNRDMCRVEEMLLKDRSESRLVTDVVAIGDKFEGNNPERFNYIRCRVEETGPIRDLKVDGVLGLSSRRNDKEATLLDTLMNEKMGVFSTCLSEYGGMLTMGGYDKKYHTEDSMGDKDVKWVRLHSQDKYQVPIKGMSIGGKVIGGEEEIRTILEIESPLTYVPERIHRQLRQVVTEHCDKSESCRASSGMCWRVEDNSVMDWPVIQMKLEETIVDFHPRSFMYRTTGKEVCLGIESIKEELIILGQTFFKEKQIIFDRERNVLGIVEAKCPQFMHRPEERKEEGQAIYERAFAPFSSDTEVMSKWCMEHSTDNGLCDEAAKEHFTAMREVIRCRDTDYFERNEKLCMGKMNHIMDTIENCDIPNFLNQNLRMCEIVRFHGTQQAQRCLDRSFFLSHRRFCDVIENATNHEQKVCTEDTHFYEQHRMTCEDNQHYFVEFQQLQCMNRDFFNNHREVCGKVEGYSRTEQERCDDRQYYFIHRQACDFQRSFNSSLNRNCSNDNIGEMCAHVLASSELQMHRCQSEDYRLKHGTTCQVIEHRVHPEMYGHLKEGTQEHRQSESAIVLNSSEVEHRRADRDYLEMYGQQEESAQEYRQQQQSGQEYRQQQQSGQEYRQQQQQSGQEYRQQQQSGQEYRQQQQSGQEYRQQQQSGEVSTILQQDSTSLHRHENILQNWTPVHRHENMLEDSTSLRRNENIFRELSLCQFDNYLRINMSQCNSVYATAQWELERCDRERESEEYRREGQLTSPPTYCHALFYFIENHQQRCNDIDFISLEPIACEIRRRVTAEVRDECVRGRDYFNRHRHLCIDTEFFYQQQEEQLCGCAMFFQKNEKFCRRTVERLDRMIERCEVEEDFQRIHITVCEGLRQFLLRQQSRCATDLSFRSQHLPICVAQDMLTRRERRRCQRGSYSSKHNLICQTNLHIFVQMEHRECVEESRTFSESPRFCAEQMEMAEILSRRCDEQDYYVEHLQVCDSQRFTVQQMKELCNDRTFYFGHLHACEQQREMTARTEKVCMGEYKQRRSCDDNFLAFAEQTREQCNDRRFYREHMKDCQMCMREVLPRLLKRCDNDRQYFLLHRIACEGIRYGTEKQMLMCEEPDYFSNHEICRQMKGYGKNGNRPFYYEHTAEESVQEAQEGSNMNQSMVQEATNSSSEKVAVEANTMLKQEWHVGEAHTGQKVGEVTVAESDGTVHHYELPAGERAVYRFRPKSESREVSETQEWQDSL